MAAENSSCDYADNPHALSITIACIVLLIIEIGLYLIVSVKFRKQHCKVSSLEDKLKIFVKYDPITGERIDYLELGYDSPNEPAENAYALQNVETIRRDNEVLDTVVEENEHQTENMTLHDDHVGPD